MNRRPGFTILEMVVAAGILAVLLTTTVHMLRVLTGHQRASDRRAIAIEAVQAVAEQISNLPWDQLTTESAQQITMPRQLEARLPGTKVTIEVAEETSPVVDKRIMVELTWVGQDKATVSPIRLTTWAFRD